MNEKDKENYKHHPRVLEVRFSMLMQIMEKEFGVVGTEKFLDTVCKVYSLNTEIMHQIFNNRFEIRRMSVTNRVEWFKTMVFVGYLYGIKPYTVATYMGYNKSYPYVCKLNEKELTSQDFLNKLNDQICLCRMSTHKVVLENFMDLANSFGKVFNDWHRLGL